jgi:anionic cell wall polymer biosynthesis LytR-Cps2A-Psr (LCP) family protein
VPKSVRLYVAVGAVVVVLLGAGLFVGIRLLSGPGSLLANGSLFGPGSPVPTLTPTPTPSPTPPPGSDIQGPLNFLIVGIDTRSWVADWVPHADAVMIMHVSADLTTAYLTSLPRDLVVNIPAFAPARFGGARTKLTHAMSYGAKIPGTTHYNAAQGFQLVAATVTAYTGVAFNGGAMLTFEGLRLLVDALGGIDMYIDQYVVSIHMGPNATYRTPCGGCAHGLGGPQMVYNVGNKHIVGWEALDYSRQRYIAGGDYARQRHQRQVIKAVVAKVFSAETTSSPTAMVQIMGSLGPWAMFDGRGRSLLEYAYALRKVRPNTLVLVGLPGGGVSSGGTYIGEALNGIEASYFNAVKADTVAPFLAGNPSLTNGMG